MLIGLSGYARSGKDTLGQALVDHHGFERIAFADKLRQVALDIDPWINWQQRMRRLSDLVELIGWDHAKGEYPEVRRLLQAIGCAVRDHIDADAWLNAALADIDVDNTNYVVTDMRFANEYEAITDLGGLTVRVVRPGIEAVNAHISERALDDHIFDVTIHNDGDIEDLATAAIGLAAMTR